MGLNSTSPLNPRSSSKTASGETLHSGGWGQHLLMKTACVYGKGAEDPRRSPLRKMSVSVMPGSPGDSGAQAGRRAAPGLWGLK